MTSAEATTFRKQAISEAHKMRFHEDAEDIAQQAVMIQITRSGSKKPRHAHDVAIDAIRSIFGDTRKKSHDVRSAINTSMKCDGDLELAGVAAPEHGEFHHAHQMIDRLKGQERVVAKLFYVWGLSRVEIEDVLGTCNLTVVKRLHKATEQLKEWSKE